MQKSLITKLGTGIVILALIFASMSGTLAFAAGNDFGDEVTKTNSDIEKIISEAIDDSDHAVNECKNKIDEEFKKLDKDSRKQDEVSRNVEKHKAVLERKLDRIAEDLLEKTNAKAYGLIKKAAKLEILVICEYVEVKLADRTYLVDPLRIVGN